MVGTQPKLSEISILAWLDEHQIKTETGKPYNLRDHMFWFDILADMSPKQVWLKAAQVGGSLAANLKLLWVVKHYGMNAIYVLPTADDVRDFVSGKTNPLIVHNPILQQYVTDKDSIEQKRIGNNTVYWRGSWTDRAALSVSSDLNIIDEEDRCKKSVIEQYASRLQHSPYKWEWHFSNPSSEGNGVDQYWKKSDQKHWFITCGSCKKKQFLSWPESINVSRETYVCKFCDADLTNDDRRRGEWHGKKMAEKPEYSGYWISLLMCPWITASHILELSKTKSAEYFYNFVLGLPYAGTGNKLNESEFFANITNEPYAEEDPIVIGVDTGLPNWYAVGNRYGLFAAGKCDGYGDIEVMLRRWSKAIVVFDQGGDLIGPRELQEKYSGRVFLCYYRSDRKTMSLIEWGKGAESGKVVADRNRTIQMLIDELRSKRIPLRGTVDDWWEAWLHFSNIYRVIREDALGQEKYEWERSGPDHLVHAMNYWRIGMDKFGMTMETSITAQSVLDGISKSYLVDPRNPGIPMDAFKKNKERDWRDL